MLREITRHLWLCAAVFSVCAAAADSSYQNGVDAFNQGDYAAALDRFTAAERAGIDNPGLRFNIAVTYYKLAQYQRAEREFEVLLDNAQWGELARFNLGLVAEQEGDLAKARYWFQSVRRDGKTPKLQMLADEKLQELSAAAARAQRAGNPPA